jgi:uncharacterized protein
MIERASQGKVMLPVSDPPAQHGAPAMRASNSFTLPLRAGIGLKTQHFNDLLRGESDVGFLEIHAENYMVDGGAFHHYLGRLRERFPLSIHGVGLSIGGQTPLDEQHLARLKALITRYEPQSFSEHLAWSSHGDTFFNDLLPLAYNAASLRRVADHVDQVQNALGRKILIENPSTYVALEASDIEETTFIRELVATSGCGLLLDVNNIHVSCVNHGFDASQYLRALPLKSVGEIHLAGFASTQTSDGTTLLIDSHGAPVADVVWQLYADAIALCGATPTLIERDNNVPALAELLAEAAQAERVMRSIQPVTKSVLQ